MPAPVACPYWRSVKAPSARPFLHAMRRERSPRRDTAGCGEVVVTAHDAAVGDENLAVSRAGRGWLRLPRRTARVRGWYRHLPHGLGRPRKTWRVVLLACHRMSRGRSLALEAGIAIAVALLSFAVAPARGIVTHWNGETASGMAVSAGIYALGALVLVPVLGRIVAIGHATLARREKAARPWRAEVAVGVLLVTFAALQRIESMSVIVVLALSFALGVVTYAAGALLTRGPEISDDESGH